MEGFEEDVCILYSRKMDGYRELCILYSRNVGMKKTNWEDWETYANYSTHNRMFKLAYNTETVSNEDFTKSAQALLVRMPSNK